VVLAAVVVHEMLLVLTQAAQETQVLIHQLKVLLVVMALLMLVVLAEQVVAVEVQAQSAEQVHQILLAAQAVRV
jgi:hypothetical protein